MAKFIVIDAKPKIAELKDGDVVFGNVEEITSKELGAGRANLTRITLWGPDFVHQHEIAEETYVCQAGEGELFVNFEIIKFVPDVRVIIGPGVLHAARPKRNGEVLIFSCLSAPAFDPKDVYLDRRGRGWELKIDPLELIGMSLGEIAHKADWGLMRLSGEFDLPESPEETEKELTNVKYGLALIELIKLAADDENSRAFNWLGEIIVPPRIEMGELGWGEYNKTRKQKIREVLGRMRERGEKVQGSLERLISSSEFSGPDLELCKRFFLSIL